MTSPVLIALLCAPVLAGAAAVSDWRFGLIPNWLTFPPIAAAPIAYGLHFGTEVGLQALAAGLLSGLGPYLMFRHGAMGGGDVKLFAALGVITGFDPLAGVHIELLAFAAAMLIALCALAWRGALTRTVTHGVGIVVNRLLPSRFRLPVSSELLTPVRMGGPIFLATSAHVLVYLASGWSAS